MAFSTIQGSGGAPDSFVGTSGVDAITFVGSTTDFFLGAQEENDSVTFTAATVFTPLVISNGTFRGGAGDDVFATDDNSFFGEDNVTFNNVMLNGNAGDDILQLNGLLAGSTVLGGKGSDEIDTSGQIENTRVNGNKGDDSIDINGFQVRSSIFGGQGDDEISVDSNGSDSIIRGDDGDDEIVVVGVYSNTTINGNAGDDIIDAFIVPRGEGGNVIFGGKGDDEIDAVDSSTDLELFGNDGNDTIIGGTGEDTITGGTGADRLTGGIGDASPNTFVFSTGDSLAATGKFNGGVSFSSGVDFVTDFNNGIDTYLINGVEFESSDFGTVVGFATIDISGDYVLGNPGTNATTWGIRGNFDELTNTFTDTGVDSYLFFQLDSAGELGQIVNSLTTEAIISDLA